MNKAVRRAARNRTSQARCQRPDERGMALLVAVLSTLLLSAVAAALVLTTTANAMIAANSGSSVEAYYAAEAVFERTAAELGAATTLTSVLNGTRPSSFVDGAGSGSRTLSDGTSIDLTQIVSYANCGKPTPCSLADLNATTPDRPWGTHNPRWRLFSYGALDNSPQSGWSGAPIYVVSLIADDPSETDDDPLQDGLRIGTDPNPGAGLVLVRGEAFGRRGAHRAVEGTVVRLDLAAIARWDAADPATRGEPPPAVPVLRRLTVQEVR